MGSFDFRRRSKELNKLGIKTIKKAPKNNEVAFLCVYHKQFKEYLRDFQGISI